MSSQRGWLLGIHTTTPSLGLALLSLSDQAEAVRSQSWWLDRSLASQMHICLDTFLHPQTWSDLMAIGVAIGPGSFTGTRLGVTVARTLGQSLDIPVAGISSLAAVACTYGTKLHLSQPAEVWVEMDAQRGEWLGGQYRIEPTTGHIVTLVADRLWSGSEWAKIKAKSETVCIEECKYRDPPPAIAIAQLAAQRLQDDPHPSHWHDIEPFYGRQPPIHGGS